MAEELNGSNDEPYSDAGTAELEPVSQATLRSLLEEVRAGCLRPGIESGGVALQNVEQSDGEPATIDMHFFGDDDGPMLYDFDGELAKDTSGVYRYFAPKWYHDTNVQASIYKIERAKESQLDGQEFVATYEIRKIGEILDVRCRISPLNQPRWSVPGDPLPKDTPPLLTQQERIARRLEEDALGLSSVSEVEANDLRQLITTSS